MQANKRYAVKGDCTRARSLAAWGVGLVLVGLISSCTAAKQRKSEKYYLENKQVISEIRQLFNTLYEQQPISAGFSDRSCKYFVLEVLTDSVRFIYNGKRNRPQLVEAAQRFGVDTMQLRMLSSKLRHIKCLWISKRSFYVDRQRETVTFLSFKSTSRSSIFTENKYYTLIFPPRGVFSRHFRERIKRGDLIKVEDGVWFTIGSNFR